MFRTSDTGEVACWIVLCMQHLVPRSIHDGSRAWVLQFPWAAHRDTTRKTAEILKSMGIESTWVVGSEITSVMVPA